MADMQFEEFVRSRITNLRMEKNVSEHRMSLELDKSGSYIRSITSGSSMPSLKELFHIIAYFGMTPVEFFAPMSDNKTLYSQLCERLRALDETDLEKVNTFVDWILE